MNQEFKNLRELESELFYPFISSLGFRSELTEVVKLSTQRRKDSFTQKELSKIIGIPLTKIKQIENGSCKDFNSIHNYICFFGYKLIFTQW